MLDDVLHNQCVQDTDVDQVMVVEVDQVMVVVEVDQVMVVVEVETVQLEINTKEEVVHEHHTEDKVAITRRSGNLTLKDKD